MSERPDVCVVVVTFNGAPWIRQCLASLRLSRGTLQVLVVDNASSDDTCRIVETEFAGVQLLRSGGNVGFGRGNNIGIRVALDAGARYVFLLNQDAYALPDALDRLLDFMDAQPQIGVSSPLQCSPDAEHIDARTQRGYLQPYAQRYLGDACMGRIADHYLVHGLNAAAWFVRRETFERAGGFDPLFFMYGEDDDLLTRWAYHRISFALLTGCCVVHLRQSPPSPQPGWTQDILRRARRRRSELLAAIKRPGYSLRHMLLVGCAQGWLAPLIDLLERHDARDFLACWLAALQIGVDFGRIRRHAILSARSGAHFL